MTSLSIKKLSAAGFLIIFGVYLGEQQFFSHLYQNYLPLEDARTGKETEQRQRMRKYSRKQRQEYKCDCNDLPPLSGLKDSSCWNSCLQEKTAKYPSDGLPFPVAINPPGHLLTDDVCPSNINYAKLLMTRIKKWRKMSDKPWQLAVDDKLGTFVFVRSLWGEDIKGNNERVKVRVPDIYWCGDSLESLRDFDFRQMPVGKGFVIKYQMGHGSQALYVLPSGIDHTSGLGMEFLQKREMNIEDMIQDISRWRAEHKTESSTSAVYVEEFFPGGGENLPFDYKYYVVGKEIAGECKLI